MLSEIVLNELRKICNTVRKREDDFLKIAAENNEQKHGEELKVAKNKLAQTDNRIVELDKLFMRLYEDNVSGKISDERFKTMSANYENEQQELKILSEELNSAIQQTEQKTANAEQFVKIVKKYTEISELTPPRLCTNLSKKSWFMSPKRLTESGRNRLIFSIGLTSRSARRPFQEERKSSAIRHCF